MANPNSNVFETKLSKRMQMTRYSTPVFSAICSFEERSNLSNGESVVRPTFGRLYADTYVRGTDGTVQGYSEGSETLTVNTTPIVVLQADNFDKIQHLTNLQDKLASDGVRAINKHVDADVLSEVVNATSTVDAGDIGGTAGSAIIADQTNVLKVYSAALRKLQLQNIDITGALDPRTDMGNMKPGGKAGFAVIPPHFHEQLSLSLAGRETVTGDQTGKNGYVSSYFGFDNFVSTNGYWVGVLGLATNPTDGDTILVNGVTVTFKATLTAASGSSEVHIASTVDITRANLAEFLNAPTTSEAEATDTGYSSMSTANARLLNRMTFTNDNSANTLTVAAKGYGHVVVSETLTAAADVWNSEIAYVMFGQKGAIDMVMQSEVSVKVSDIPLQLGAYIKPNCLYGKKTFTEGAQAMVLVKLDTSSWS